jgi:hypothetical protein
LITKVVDSKEDMDTALQEYKNADMQDSPPPSEMFFKRRLRGVLPQLKKNINVSENVQMKEKRRRKYLQRGPQGVLLPIFEVNDPVWLFDRSSKRWDIRARISKVRSKRRSYWVITEDGTSYLRNRIFLKARELSLHESDSIMKPDRRLTVSMSEDVSPAIVPRQSARQRSPLYNSKSVVSSSPAKKVCLSRK